MNSITDLTRTFVPKTPSLDEDDLETTKLFVDKTNPPGMGNGVKDLIEYIWMSLISILVMISRFIKIAVENIEFLSVQLYRILNFCYRKPHHAKELFLTTIHLIKVSYDAEIWSWSEMWEMIKLHLITPMSRKPKDA
uniref:DUF3452 domain-containing protein n=1 Tax=Caenorhabditis tropicalis TaxID=1561998 RepID=A0A1I7UBR4_9PELO